MNAVLAQIGARWLRDSDVLTPVGLRRRRSKLGPSCGPISDFARRASPTRPGFGRPTDVALEIGPPYGPASRCRQSRRSDTAGCRQHIGVAGCSPTRSVRRKPAALLPKSRRGQSARNLTIAGAPSLLSLRSMYASRDRTPRFGRAEFTNRSGLHLLVNWLVNNLRACCRIARRRGRPSGRPAIGRSEGRPLRLAAAISQRVL